MTEKKLKKYLKAIERRLNLPREVRNRIIDDLRSSITAKREAGMSAEQIMAELGSPKRAAANLNDQMKEFAYRKSPWRYVFLALAGYGAVEMLGGLAAWLTLWMMRKEVILEAATIGVIGGADGPTAIFVTAPAWTGNLLPAAAIIIGIWGILRFSRCKKKSE